MSAAAVFSASGRAVGWGSSSTRSPSMSLADTLALMRKVASLCPVSPFKVMLVSSPSRRARISVMTPGVGLEI